MSRAVIVYAEIEDSDVDEFMRRKGFTPPYQLATETDNFLIVWADEFGLHRHFHGPGPWELVIEQMGDRVDAPDWWSRQAKPQVPGEEDLS